MPSCRLWSGTRPRSHGCSLKARPGDKRQCKLLLDVYVTIAQTRFESSLHASCLQAMTPDAAPPPPAGGTASGPETARPLPDAARRTSASPSPPRSALGRRRTSCNLQGGRSSPARQLSGERGDSQRSCGVHLWRHAPCRRCLAKRVSLCTLRQAVAYDPLRAPKARAPVT